MGKNPEQLFEQAMKDWLEGGMRDHDKALEDFENILILLGHGDYDIGILYDDPDDAYHYDNLTQKVHLYKGDCLVLFKNLFKEGMLEYDKAIQINPENKDMWKHKIANIKIYQERKRQKDDRAHPEFSKEVIKCCEKLLSIDKEFLFAWFAKSGAYCELKRYEEAIDCEDNLLRLLPDNDVGLKSRISSLLNKATCYYFMEKNVESKKCLLEVLELDPYNEEALGDLHDIELKIAKRYPYHTDTKISKRFAYEENGLKNKKETSTFCENCGNSLKPTAKFCGSCGTPRA